MYARELTVRRIPERAATFKILSRNSRHRVQVLASLNAFPDSLDRQILLVFLGHGAIMTQGYDINRCGGIRGGTALCH
ncbi:hypothetical protein SAMN06264365_13057 [Actinoplanes regularis]|uniref:Uncharacterized protein n=1 Tax=Actinoplanes regularis TaxID=52697 RepID=A0A239IPW8_9ACTN|nr:hypothetical protein SAMN06264365_13057 [Actinoplanes regularis]